MFREIGALVLTAFLLTGCASAEGVKKNQAVSDEDVKYLTAAMDLAQTARTHFIFAEEMRNDALDAFAAFDNASVLIALADDVHNDEADFAVFEAAANEERATLRARLQASTQKLDELGEVISAFPDSARPDALALIDRVKAFREDAVANAENLLDIFTPYAQGDPDALGEDADRLLNENMRPFLYEYADIVAESYAYEQARIVDISGGLQRPLMFGTQAEYVDLLRLQSKSFAEILRSAFSQPCEDGVRTIPSGLESGFPGDGDIDRLVSGLDKTASGFGLLAISSNGQLANGFQAYMKQIAFVQDTKDAIRIHEDMRLAVYEEFFSMIRSPEFSVCDLSAEDPFKLDLFEVLNEILFPDELNADRADIRREYYDSALEYYRGQLAGLAKAE